MKKPGVSLHWGGGYKAEYDSMLGQQLVDAWRKDHMNNRGWKDIGYQYIVHRDTDGQWKVFDGRPDSWSGAHSGTSYGNSFIGINVAYGKDEPKVPDGAWDVLVKLIAELSKVYGFSVSSSTIKGHRDFLPTQCPGNKLYASLPRLIKDVQDFKKNKKKRMSLPDQSTKKQPKGEEQITRINVNMLGQKRETIRINGQTYLYVGELRKLGYDPFYDAQSDEVTLRPNITRLRQILRSNGI